MLAAVRFCYRWTCEQMKFFLYTMSPQFLRTPQTLLQMLSKVWFFQSTCKVCMYVYICMNVCMYNLTAQSFLMMRHDQTLCGIVEIHKSPVRHHIHCHRQAWKCKQNNVNTSLSAQEITVENSALFKFSIYHSTHEKQSILPFALLHVIQCHLLHSYPLFF